MNTQFFRIISLYVHYRQRRLAVAVAFVLPTDKPVAIIDRLLQRIQSLQIRIDVLSLARGLCSGPVLTCMRPIHRKPMALTK